MGVGSSGGRFCCGGGCDDGGCGRTCAESVFITGLVAATVAPAMAAAALGGHLLLGMLSFLA